MFCILNILFYHPVSEATPNSKITGAYCRALVWSEYVSGLSTTDLFLKVFGAIFFTLKVWWISSTYNHRFIALLAPQ